MTPNALKHSVAPGICLETRHDADGKAKHVAVIQGGYSIRDTQRAMYRAHHALAAEKIQIDNVEIVADRFAESAMTKAMAKRARKALRYNQAAR